MEQNIKSIRLYGKPNKEKLVALRKIQSEYTNGINAFISMLWEEQTLYADVFCGRSTTAPMRAYEKSHRFSPIGSAMSQTAFDEAVEKLSTVFVNVRKDMLKTVSKNDDEFLFVLSKTLFAAALAGDGFEVAYGKMFELLGKVEKKYEKESGFAKTNHTCDFYRECIDKMTSLGKKRTEGIMESVRTLFEQEKNYRNIPHVGRAWVRADSRAQTLAKSEDIVAPYVLSATTTVGGKRTEIPLSTSPDSLRRLNQYDVASTVIYSVKSNGVLLVNVAVKKSVRQKSKKDVFVGADAGITDVISSSDGKFYGTLLPAQEFYDDVVLLNLGRLQTLRNLIRKTRIKLHHANDDDEKERLRRKICHINTMIQQNKVVGRSLNRYEAIVDKEISDVVKAFVADRLKDSATSVFEALDITTFKRGRKSNRRDSMWARGKLLKRLEESLSWYGLSFIEVEPSYTSQVCPVCGHLEKANRDGKTFKCLHCGHVDDADHNAAVNIRERATDKELKSLLAKPSTLYQKQSALREWYAKKEKAYDESLNLTVSSA